MRRRHELAVFLANEQGKAVGGAGRRTADGECYVQCGGGDGGEDSK